MGRHKGLASLPGSTDSRGKALACFSTHDSNKKTPSSGVTWGNGTWVAVAWNGTGDRLMTSINGGLTWVGHSVPAQMWESVCFGAGKFVVVGSTGVGNRVLLSSDQGATWTQQSSAADNEWR